MTRAGLALACAGLLGACNAPSRPEGGLPAGVAAQVGEAVLTEADVARALAVLPAGVDSAEARRQIVEPWLRRELLVADARRLAAEPDVAERLAEAERAVLEAAALARGIADDPASAPTAAQVAAYHAAHPAEFTLAAPAVRVRHLRVNPPDAARVQAAAAALGRVAASARPDSTFALAAREFSSDPAGAVAFAAQFVTEARLADTDAALARAVASLAAGAGVATSASGRTVHVVQVAERLPAGAVLPLSAARGEIADRLGVGLRKEAAARLVERLRAAAAARGALSVR